MALTHLALSTGHGKYLCTDVRKNGGKFICTPVKEYERLAPSKFKKPLLISFASAQTLVLLEEFPPLPHKLLVMHVERQLENRALMDEGVESAITCKIVDTKGEKKLHSLVILPRNDVRPQIEDLVQKRIFIRAATPALAALGALTARLTAEPVIVIMARENSNDLTAFRNGIPLYMQPLPVTEPGEFDTTMLKHAILVCRQTLLRDFQIEKARILLMGEKRNSIDITWAEPDHLEPDWKSLPISSARQSIRNWPELYGTLFIKQDYSYLPREYFLSHKIKKINNWTTAVCTLAAIALSVIAWNTYQHNTSTKYQLAKQQSELDKRIEKLRKNLPASDSLKKLEHYLDILGRGILEPRLANILETITLAMPQTIHIEKLTVGKATPDFPADEAGKRTGISLPPRRYAGRGPQKKIPTDTQTPEDDQKKSVVMNISFSSEGSYKNVRADFEETVMNLSRSFILKNIEWGYMESEETGYLKGQLWVRKEKKQ